MTETRLGITARLIILLGEETTSAVEKAEITAFLNRRYGSVEQAKATERRRLRGEELRPGGAS